VYGSLADRSAVGSRGFLGNSATRPDPYAMSRVLASPFIDLPSETDPMHQLDRRGFVTLAAASAAGIAAQLSLGSAAFGRQATAPGAASTGGKASKPLSFLILGGTAFLGPEVVEAAQKRGHSITLFNRGKTRPSLFPNIEKLQGDRDPDKGEGLKAIQKALETRTWDVVIDNSGYFPRHVKASAELLGPKVKQYIYISSISAFKEGAPPNSDESFPDAVLSDPTVETMGDQFQNYGGLKALCEKAAEAAMPGRVANIRPGFIVGPGDWTGRFSYWPLRARKGGEMLGPGAATDPVQWIDVRDLAEWMVLCAERSVNGLFAATGPGSGGTIGDIITASIKVAKATEPKPGSVDTTVTWVPADFLMSHGVSPGGDLPIWLPSEGETAGFHRWNVKKAVMAGLTFRPVEETVRGINTWIDGLNEEDRKRIRPAGMSLEREKEVLAAFHASAKTKSTPDAAPKP
jgi:2'-hydroxyisoflavone reductase